MTYCGRLKAGEDSTRYLRVSLARRRRCQVIPQVAEAVQDSRNAVFLSVVSFWEIPLKHSLGKLPLPQPPALFVLEQREKHFIAPMALDEAAVALLGGLPELHRDPFDRMLICQAKAHALALASSDALVRQYPVALL